MEVVNQGEHRWPSEGDVTRESWLLSVCQSSSVHSVSDWACHREEHKPGQPGDKYIIRTTTGNEVGSHGNQCSNFWGGGVGDFPPPTTYRRSWHYKSSTCAIPPLNGGWALKNILFQYLSPLYFFDNSSTDGNDRIIKRTPTWQWTLV